MAFKRSGVRLPLSPPKRNGLQTQSVFSLVEICGQEALCKLQANEKIVALQRPKRADSNLPGPSEGWGVGSDSPRRLRRDLHQKVKGTAFAVPFAFDGDIQWESNAVEKRSGGAF